MAWTEIARAEHVRAGPRYASDVTDAEWAIVGPFLERPTNVGPPAKHTRRNIWDAVRYLAASGCQWRMPPKDFPPYSTVRHYFYRWRDSGSIVAIDEALTAASRLAAGRAEAASAGIIDSQSVKTTECGGPRGHDAGKKVKGRERHIVIDTLGNILDAVVHTADIQDRDGAPDLIECVRENFPALARIFADGGYAREKLAAAIAHLGGLALEIVKRSDAAAGFVVLPKRWIVERTFAWLGRCRRLAKDWEASIASSEAWLFLASVQRLTRAIARA